MEKELDPNVWGKHYWFFLHTIAITYPLRPNEATKKKYYELIQNMPLFIPSIKLGDKFITYLEKYPVSSYLDSRIQFMKWVHFLHNKINEDLNKPKINFQESIRQYYNHYKPKETIEYKTYKFKKKVFFIVVCIFIVMIGFILYYTDYYKKI